MYIFFRDPRRKILKNHDYILSPADGTIQSIIKVTSPETLNNNSNYKEWNKISIFLNIFDVHINRIPINGIIQDQIYKRGCFHNAFFG